MKALIHYHGCCFIFVVRIIRVASNRNEPLHLLFCTWLVDDDETDDILMVTSLLYGGIYPPYIYISNYQRVHNYHPTIFTQFIILIQFTRIFLIKIKRRTLKSSCSVLDNWAAGSTPLRGMFHHSVHLIVPCARLA